jgi:pimeloyl-ACP methyl ester carboxylesterase
MRDGYATVNGVRLHYVEDGEGDPVVLLPGWPRTWWEFHKIMPKLAVTHRVIAVDLRGMGESAKPEGGYDKKTMAADIAALLHELGHDRADVVGSDIGAMVAFSLAANHPELVRTVTASRGGPVPDAASPAAR